MQEAIARIKKDHALSGVFLIVFFVAFQYILVIYINSSFLKEFASEKTVGWLYTLAAAVSILAFFLAPKVIKKVGAKKTLVWAITAQVICLFGLGFSDTVYLIIPLFVAQYSLTYILYYSLDVILEGTTDKETATGSIRGLYLTFANTAVILAPSALSLVIGNENYSRAYILAAAILIPALFLTLKKIPNLKPETKTHTGISKTLKDLEKDKDLKKIIFVNFLLQFFFSWMIIYTPIYLHEFVGFSWSTLGFIFSIMLIPFVLIEAPAGYLADAKFGEKEMLIIGLLTMSAATALLSFIDLAVFWLWASALFITRIGASLIEVSTDTYFFKKVKDQHANIISVYRSTVPFAYIVAPAIFTLTGSKLAGGTFYLILAAITLSGVFVSLKIKDTL